MRDGRVNHCKPCVLEADKARYAKNSEAKRAYQKQYYSNADKAKIAAAKKVYNAKNAQSISERKAAYRQEHADEIRAYFARYKAENPDVIKKHDRRRKIRERGTFVADVSDADLESKLRMFGGLCVYCAGDLSDLGIHWDHWKPLSKGGLHMLSNLYPSCPRCNLSKSAKWPFQTPKNFAARAPKEGAVFL